MADPRTTESTYPVVLPADPIGSHQAATKSYVDGLNAGKVNKTGDTLTGPLTLAGLPIGPNEAASKAYVDLIGSPTAAEVAVTPIGGVSSTDVQAALQELDTEKVAKAGDTMLGSLYLSNPTPLLQQEAAPKGYVDTMGSKEIHLNPGSFTWDAGREMYAVDINHGLNRRPKVTIYDPNGVEINGDVVYSTIGINGLTVRLKANIDSTILLT